jgi:hypothetical protein
MPAKLDRCVADVKKKIKKGELEETYEDKATGKKKKTNPYAICKAKIKE